MYIHKHVWLTSMVKLCFIGKRRAVWIFESLDFCYTILLIQWNGREICNKIKTVGHDQCITLDSGYIVLNLFSSGSREYLILIFRWYNYIEMNRSFEIIMSGRYRVFVILSGINTRKLIHTGDICLVKIYYK